MKILNMENDMHTSTGLMPPTEMQVVSEDEVPEYTKTLKGELLPPKIKKPKKIPKPRVRQVVQEKSGRPFHQPSDLTRNQVKMFCEMGIPHEMMAELLQISRPTLYAHYKAELKHGTTELRARVLTSMFNVALDPNHKDMVKAAMYVMRAHQHIMGEPAKGADGQLPNTITATRTIDVNKLSFEQRQNLREIMLAAQGKSDQLSITHQQEEPEQEDVADDEDGDE